MKDMQFATLRLGKTSVNEIKHIDQMIPGIVMEPTSITVVCTQIPSDLAPMTYAFLWLGSDNSKGMPTEWKQGFKAIGLVKSVDRGEKYNDESTTVLDIKYVFRNAVNRLDILRDAAEEYFWCSSLPIIGLDDHSNQTIRMFTPNVDRCITEAFFCVLSAVDNKFREEIIKVDERFADMFSFDIPNPHGGYSEFMVSSDISNTELTIGELGRILQKMYNTAPKDMQTTSIHAFGIKYGKVITEKNYPAKDIAIAAQIPESYQAEIGKGVRLYKSFLENYFGISLWGKDGKLFEEPKGKRQTGAENVLLYGVPGAGKSYYIQKNYCNDRSKMERVVFHPDYTNSDFIGQILPRVDNGQLQYVFTPGPFTNILKEAWWNPENKYYLIIEEINRGNAPAIFGEIFQLLDRDIDGASTYSITNFDIAQEVYGDREHDIILPSNLWILATMNTADQNVFTLDTAFQRRWVMHQIDNDVMSATHSNMLIEGSNVTWGAFATVINDQVLDENDGLSSSEDKRLGAYFAIERELRKDRFPEKVLKYLWDDAFKLNRDMVFSDEMRSLEMVVDTYRNTDTDRLKAVLRLETYNRMLSMIKPIEEGESDGITVDET